MKDPADQQQLAMNDDVISSSTESHNSDNDSLLEHTPSTTPPYASSSAMSIDDVSNPLASFSPQSTASSNSTAPPPPPPAQESAQEALEAQLRSMARRPGFGIGESLPQVLQLLTLSPMEARSALGCEADGDFTCKNLQGGETVMVLEYSTYLKIKTWLAEEEEEKSTLHVVVNNTSLFELYESVERPGRTKYGLKENVDYVLISEKSWALLMEWFGGGPSITRKCVNDNGKLLIDLRGIELKCKRSSKPNKFLRFVFSKYDTVGMVKRTVVNEWAESYHANSDVSLYRLWDYSNDRRYVRLQSDSSQLTALNLNDNQVIMFEEADPVTRDFPWDEHTDETLGSAPAAASSSTYWDNSSRSTYGRRPRAENQVVSSRTPVSPGVVGLSNLGNTCFMNSTLQCLNHVWMLRKHFTSDDYLQEVNETNPLGTGGKLAKSFGELMKLMWSNEGDVISPAGFKSQMAEFKPEFSGYQQHDSQELLSFLLDGLHEDLNRIKQKPITKAVEGNGRPDSEVAAECKQVHHLRNDSMVNDLFEGFYRSTLVCPDCHKKSVTFDPFSVIQLPVSKSMRGGEGKLIPVHVTVLDTSTCLPPPTTLQSTTLRIPVDSFLYEVRSKVGESACAKDTVLCKVRQGRIEKLLRDTDQKDKYSKDDQIIAFQHPMASKFRAKQELVANSAWHRPLQSQEEPASLGEAPQPLGKGTVWIGSADNHNIRMRLEVVEQGEFGMWEQGLGCKLKCIVDISPVSNNAYDKNDGVEEYAYEVEGLLVSSAKATAVLGRSAFEAKFDTTHAPAQSFGSYVGRFPRHDQNKKYDFELTCSLDGDFVHGKFTEQQQQYRYSSVYNTSQAFALQKVQCRADLVTVAELGEIGPAKEPRARDSPFPITLFHDYMYDHISQPMLLLLDCNKALSPKQLYEMVLEVLTKRIRLRNTKNLIIENSEGSDPFGLTQLFTLTIPKHAQVKLDRGDDAANLFTLHREVLSVCIVWASDKLPKNTPLYRALFSLLYSEDRDGAGVQTRGNTLGDCFDLFSEEEKLTPSEAWYCSNCKEHKEAFKRMEIWDLSDVLVIQMKRFSQSQSSYSFDKDDSEVDFPLEGLDLNKRVLGGGGNGSYVYDLVAVSHHYGGLGGGHYVAHARDEQDGTWYELDDSNVRMLGDCEAAASRIKKSSAYVLFYAKRDKTPESWRKPQTSSTSAL